MTTAKLSEIEREDLNSIFFRTWTKEILGPNKPKKRATMRELHRWMSEAERKIITAVKAIHKDQKRRYFTVDKVGPRSQEVQEKKR